jgi:hypothetical protein
VDFRGRSSSSRGRLLVDEDTTDSGRFREDVRSSSSSFGFLVDDDLRRPLCDEESLLFPVSLFHILTMCPRLFPRRENCEGVFFGGDDCGAVGQQQVESANAENSEAGQRSWRRESLYDTCGK